MKEEMIVYSYKVINENGQEMMRGVQFPESGLSVTKLTSGTYQLLLYSGKEVKMTLFIKE
jgi:hypothetical protein